MAIINQKPNTGLLYERGLFEGCIAIDNGDGEV